MERIDLDLAGAPCRDSPDTTCRISHSETAWHGAKCIRPWSGNPAVIGPRPLRPAILRPQLSPGLPFSDP